MAPPASSSSRSRDGGPGPGAGDPLPSAGGAAPAGTTTSRRVLVLHGNRQTGELLLGRMTRLSRKLGGGTGTGNGTTTTADPRYRLVAPDAPFEWSRSDEELPDDEDRGDGDVPMRTWWRREGSSYVGLERSLRMLHEIWTATATEGADTGGGGGGGDDVESSSFDGIIGFSQGARLAHLIAHLHARTNGKLFPELGFVIMASGYDAPVPTNFSFVGAHRGGRGGGGGGDGGILRDMIDAAGATGGERDVESEVMEIDVPSLHVIGLGDNIVPPDLSRRVVSKYNRPAVHEHVGGHHLPMKARDVETYLKFICEHGRGRSEVVAASSAAVTHPSLAPKLSAGATEVPPDEEHSVEHINECEAISLIYPDEFSLLSGLRPGKLSEDADTEDKYEHPIEYSVLLHDPQNDGAFEDDDASLWPPKKISLRIRYPPAYPDVPPLLSLDHKMNMLEFGAAAEGACLEAVRAAAGEEAGMPCAMGCVLAAREFFEGGGLEESAAAATPGPEGDDAGTTNNDDDDGTRMILGTKVDSDRMKCCDIEGQDIATSLLKASSTDAPDDSRSDFASSGGGSWKYTIGLVGKPSAGKSTFFNAASAFARQRDDDGEVSFGASMAPHPFTTIDPNVGFCYVPAPLGSCPEDGLEDAEEVSRRFGSIHGRDSRGRRLLPVKLKDVAGLVPGAYQGRGRGNKFLDDLTDADVLVHVVDASGTADAEGNQVGEEGAIHPLQDLAWVRNELIEWVCSNLESKWDTISRRGRNKLAGMFSGYKQSEAFVWDVLLSVERFMQEVGPGVERDWSLDNLDEWDGGDLRRLVSCFLGVRFPMALALNKFDLPTSATYVSDIIRALPVHGAHAGVPLSAVHEMEFVRAHMADYADSKLPRTGEGRKMKASSNSCKPEGVWTCLQSAMSLREPAFAFPVADLTTYEPLPGMANYATRDASLPNPGMISCLEAAGGVAPTLWDKAKGVYHVSEGKKETDSMFFQPLRDVIMMKPGSTVEDVFKTLKGMGALRGEFVRAEGAGEVGEKSRLIPKQERLGKTNRILKIMTNKRI